MSKNSKKEIFVRICPRCGSKKVENKAMVSNMGQFYACKSCGFGGSLFPEIPKKYADKMKDRSMRYSTTLAPTKKPLSIPLFLFYLVTSTIIIVSLIILSR
jgi:predicted RNA-binding Zn-ribbon protein involved in translation (DUF1610 family)